MTEPMTLISRIADTGEIDREAARWLADALRGWWVDGSDPARLATFLRLATGSRFEVCERNRWLRQAGEEMPEHQRAATLFKAIGVFMRQKWPAWRGMSVPPECNALDAALFYAADSGASMRITRRTVCNILNGK